MRNVNPYLCKKGYYITEMNFGDGGEGYKLISTTDLRGPFKTLVRARTIYNSMFSKKDWNFGIRGPEYKREEGVETIWYPTVNRSLS